MYNETSWSIWVTFVVLPKWAAQSNTRKLPLIMDKPSRQICAHEDLFLSLWNNPKHGSADRWQQRYT